MINREEASFRDPSGYVYYDKNKVFRRINKCYFRQYEYFIKSGLYDELVNEGLVISHKKIKQTKNYIVLEVEKIPFISYAYEWCFDELRDAALLTLKIQKIALKYGMYLKDASNFNIQFLNGKATFIDILSFDFYVDGLPWGAYGQFCRHFMAPLLLMSCVDGSLNSLLKNYIDGIPIDVANNILKGRGGFTAREHIKWHNNSISKNNNKVSCKKMFISKAKLINMIEMMMRQILRLKNSMVVTEWENYYDNTNYNDEATSIKEGIILKFLESIKLSNSDIVWDLGANDGRYSRLVSDCSCVVSFDIDSKAVNKNYLKMKKNGELNILPLILDLTNPTSSIGFSCSERKSLMERGNVKCVMALALIHHLAISNNLPLEKLAKFFEELGEFLIIEFVPKEDSQVEKLLKTRIDIFDDYNFQTFEKTFSSVFKIIDKCSISGSKRVIYLMKRRVFGEE